MAILRYFNMFFTFWPFCSKLEKKIPLPPSNHFNPHTGILKIAFLPLFSSPVHLPNQKTKRWKVETPKIKPFTPHLSLLFPCKKRPPPTLVINMIFLLRNKGNLFDFSNNPKLCFSLICLQR